MLVLEAFEGNGELNIAGADYVLDFEFFQGDLEAHFFDGLHVDFSGLFGQLFAFGSGADHFAAGEDEGGGFGFSDSHDDGSESFGVVLCVFAVDGDVPEIEFALEVGSGDDVLKGGQRHLLLLVLHEHGGH